MEEEGRWEWTGGRGAGDVLDDDGDVGDDNDDDGGDDDVGDGNVSEDDEDVDDDGNVMMRVMWMKRNLDDVEKKCLSLCHEK